MSPARAPNLLEGLLERIQSVDSRFGCVRLSEALFGLVSEFLQARHGGQEALRDLYRKDRGRVARELFAEGQQVMDCDRIFQSLIARRICERQQAERFQRSAYALDRAVSLGIEIALFEQVFPPYGIAVTPEDGEGLGVADGRPFLGVLFQQGFGFLNELCFLANDSYLASLACEAGPALVPVGVHASWLEADSFSRFILPMPEEDSLDARPDSLR